MKKKILSGHLWKDDGGLAINWTGCDGIMTCQRCLAIFHYIQEHSRDIRRFDKMQDINGKIIPKKSWMKCTADYKIKVVKR